MNSIPHLVSGLQGKPFQTPFAKPPGQGLSSSTINVLWGAANLAVAYGLLAHIGAFAIRNVAHVGTAAAGALILALLLAKRFGRFNGGNSPPS